jgi:hypothetical protein
MGRGYYSNIILIVCGPKYRHRIFWILFIVLSAILIGIWAYRGGHKGILVLQFFYATAGIIGMVDGFNLNCNIPLKR